MTVRAIRRCPDVDFALFPSACRDVLLQDDAGWAVENV